MLERIRASFQNFPEFRVYSTEKGNHLNFFLTVSSDLGSNLFPAYMRGNTKDWREDKLDSLEKPLSFITNPLKLLVYSQT